METLKTAILVDGTDNPVALRIRESDKQPFISQGRAGKPPLNFRFVRPVSVKVGDEEEPRTVYLYRLQGGQLSDDEFERRAAAEADKFLHPEKYARRNEAPDKMQAELEEYRRRFGPLTKEV